jgi:hypothetical protein
MRSARRLENVLRESTLVAVYAGSRSFSVESSDLWVVR